MDTTGQGETVAFNATIAYQFWQKDKGTIALNGGIGTINIPPIVA